MSDNPNPPEQTPSNVDDTARACQVLQLLATVFWVAAGVFGLVTLGESIRYFSRLGTHGQPINVRLPILMLGAGVLVGGLVLGGVVYLAARVLTRVAMGRRTDSAGTTQLIGATNADVLDAIEELRRQVEQRPTAPAPQPEPPRIDLPELDDEVLEVVAEETEETAVAELEPEPEDHPIPAPRRRRTPEPHALPGDEDEQPETSFEQYRNTTRRFVKQEAWDKVHRMLGEIRDRFGDDPEAVAFVEQTEGLLDTNHRSQLDQLQQKVEALIEKEQWLDAILMAEEVQRKFPDVEQVKDYALKIRKRKIEASQDGRVIHHKQLMRLVAEKKWPEALKSAREYLELYPDAEDAEDVEKMLEQIRGRHDRHQIGLLSDAIKTALARKDYRTAYKGSMRMIKRFPDSKEARNLQAGLDNLKRMSETQDAS
ncbi:MAG: hypothetical protein ACOCXX_01585 [Planctomycetota bacterium]